MGVFRAAVPAGVEAWGPKMLLALAFFSIPGMGALVMALALVEAWLTRDLLREESFEYTDSGSWTVARPPVRDGLAVEVLVRDDEEEDLAVSQFVRLSDPPVIGRAPIAFPVRL